MASTFDSPIYSSDQSIERVLNAGLPVLLVLMDGVLPQGLDQALKSLAKQHAGQMLVVQVNQKDSPQTAARFRVSSTPAVVALKNGQALSQAERVDAAEVERHASFLLGRGPKPQAAPGPKPGNGTAARPAAEQTVQPGTGHPVTVTDANFEQEVLRSPIPVVVDFWAPWCGPCRMVAPTLDKLAREWNGRVKIAKVNVDENPRVAGSYQVQSIPTMMVVKGGQVADRWAGALPEAALRARLASKI
jgi:thioredoxin 1